MVCPVESSAFETFSNLKKQGKVAFIPYITAGDPDLSTTAKALKVLDSCGSDIFELGVPYSDPLADGPVIKAAASLSLARKAALTAAPSLGIAATLSNMKKQGKVSFIPYITAGDPDLSTTAEALKVLDSCGSDIFELGVPYSDPLADGPVIKAAASLSLARKAALTAAPSLVIAATLSNMKKQGKVSFIPYITAGDPDLSTTAEALKMLVSDIIELGVPYSDPLADGPVIQAAASLFLARGTNFDAITSMLKEVVRQVSSPVALFTTEQPLKAEKAYIGGSGSVPMEIDIPEDPHHVQWNNLFYGRCYIKGKLCSVVIDGGSSTNIIAEPLCNYLNLPLVRLPKPLALHGIYGGAGKAITHQTWATFTVGGYVDTHQFVVVPTSSVEVLLGRPWISKMDVTHHGRANVYDIKKDGMPIRLYPLTPVEIAELQNEIKESRAQDRS